MKTDNVKKIKIKNIGEKAAESNKETELIDKIQRKFGKCRKSAPKPPCDDFEPIDSCKCSDALEVKPVDYNPDMSFDSTPGKETVTTDIDKPLNEFINRLKFTKHNYKEENEELEKYVNGINIRKDLCKPSDEGKVAFKEYDFVNHPKHYTNYDIETIDMLERIYGVANTMLWCEMTAFKYRMRMGTKPGNDITQDLEKEKWYLNKKKELKKKL